MSHKCHGLQQDGFVIFYKSLRVDYGSPPILSPPWSPDQYLEQGEPCTHYSSCFQGVTKVTIAHLSLNNASHMVHLTLVGHHYLLTITAYQGLKTTKHGKISQKIE